MVQKKSLFAGKKDVKKSVVPIFHSKSAHPSKKSVTSQKNVFGSKPDKISKEKPVGAIKKSPLKKLKTTVSAKKVVSVGKKDFFTKKTGRLVSAKKGVSAKKIETSVLSSKTALKTKNVPSKKKTIIKRKDEGIGEGIIVVEVVSEKIPQKSASSYSFGFDFDVRRLSAEGFQRQVLTRQHNSKKK